MTHHTRRLGRAWLFMPGLTVVIFTLVSIVCPIGSDQIGPLPRNWPGLMPAAARFAQDLHDGFWRTTLSTAKGCDRSGRAVCEAGPSDEALIEKHRLFAELILSDMHNTDGVPITDSRTQHETLDALYRDGSYAEAEAFAVAVDKCDGDGVFRNNLAWFYMQDNRRLDRALALAQASVATYRQPYNVDTLAWVYYRSGDFELAVKNAREVLDMTTEVSRARMDQIVYEDPDSRESSSLLLRLIAQEHPELEVASGKPGGGR